MIITTTARTKHTTKSDALLSSATHSLRVCPGIMLKVDVYFTINVPSMILANTIYNRRDKKVIK
jgi:hypothetical protein